MWVFWFIYFFWFLDKITLSILVSPSLKPEHLFLKMCVEHKVTFGRKHNFQRILIPLVLILQMPMNLTFIELLTHGRYKMDFQLHRVFNNVSGKSLSCIKSIFFVGGHTMALSFMDTSLWNEKSLTLSLKAFSYWLNAVMKPT